jgi:hypothetical protein
LDLPTPPMMFLDVGECGEGRQCVPCFGGPFGVTPMNLPGCPLSAR